MSDRPPENPGPSVPDGIDDPAATARSLSDILDELSRITGSQHGEAAAMRGAVSELSRALARLFEMIRSDRAEQRARIAELEAALSSAHAHIRQLEAGEKTHVPAPPPNDFGQLRDAAERLRQRTEELFRDAGTPLDRQRREAAAQQAVRARPEPIEPEAQATSDAAVAAEESIGDQATELEGSGLARASEPPEAIASAVAVHDEPFGKPGILRIFPGAVLRPGGADVDIESDLDLDLDREEPRRLVAHGNPGVPEVTDGPQPWTPPQPAEPSEPQRPADVTADAPARPEPIVLAPRPARKRRGLRRRRIDARKLAGVDPASALRAMVSAIDGLWTAGHHLDLVIALTDGEALHVSGGDVRPLVVTEVASGMPARSTVTATTAQLIPLFGRLELTDEQSAPLIHGSRRDADLLVGWFDRAQRLEAEPL